MTATKRCRRVRGMGAAPTSVHIRTPSIEPKLSGPTFGAELPSGPNLGQISHFREAMISIQSVNLTRSRWWFKVLVC